MTQKILIIEDEEIMASVLADNLEMLGYEVIQAGSGLEGIRKAEMFSPDLITLDIMMPGLDGISVLEKLKRNDSTRSIPVILMSVAGDREALGLKLGAVAFFKKPFDFKSLNMKIKSLTTRRKILVVDDNPEVVQLLQLRLGLMGYEVDGAENSRAVMEKVSDNRPDVILMDVVLEEENGLEIINSLKKESSASEIPVISYSGYINDDIAGKKIVGSEKFSGRKFNIRQLAKEIACNLDKPQK